MSDINYRKLWQHVLLSTWSDAGGHKIPTPEGLETKARYRKEAREYLMTPSEDLRMLCEYADVKYDEVLRRAQDTFGGRG